MLKTYTYMTSHLRKQNPWYWNWGHCDLRKEGSKLTFFYNGSYPSFSIPEIADMKCAKIQIAIKQRGTRSGNKYLTYNGINAFYFQKLHVEKAYHRRMLRRKEVDPEGYRVYGLGEWGEVAGLILKNYVIEEFDRNPENYDYIVNSQDFGFNHANCIGEVGFKDGDLYLFQELYVYEMDTEEIIKLAAGRFNKKLRMWCDSAEPDRIKMWQKAGYRAKGVNKETNSVHAQIDYLKQHMIHIHPSCVNTIKEIQQWKWKKDERTNTYLEEPVPFFDDAMAMLRYSIEEERKAKPRLNRNLKGGL